jgi:large subunit ribosomal protein L22
METKEIKSSLKYLRIAPRKVAAVANLIKNLPVDVAKARLMLTPRRASEPLLKLLKSAIANAKNNYKIEANKLFVKSIIVNKGPMFTRWFPRAMGAVDPIQKKTTHVLLVLGVKDQKKETFIYKEIDKKEKNKTEKKQKQEENKKSEIKLKDEDKKIESVEEKKRFFRRKAV